MHTPATFTVLGGQLTLLDTPPRPTEDPLWLAATMPPLPAGSRVLDCATGSGIAALALFLRQPHLHLEALDSDPTLTALATHNATLNHIPLHTHTVDILTKPHLGPYDAILCNPPYHGEERGHSTPNPTKKQAHSLPENHLTLWLEALFTLLTPTGLIHLILHSACEAELTAFPHPNHTLILTPLQTSEKRPAKRLLATFIPDESPELLRQPPIPAYDEATRKAALT